MIDTKNPYGMPAYVIERIMEKRGRLTVFDSFDPRETALLVIDMQRFYVGEIPSVLGIIPNINRLAAHVRAGHGLVAWLGMTAGDGGQSRWHVYHDNFFTPAKGANHRDQLSAGHPGHEFHPDLDIHADDAIVYKSRFSAFVRGASNIETLLQARGIRNLIMTGTATNMCCESNARDAMMLDYRVVMVADANGARYEEDHIAGLTSFYQSFGDVRNTDEVIAQLLGGSVGAAR
jgi:ureidoacrylate peracid hydrolase